MKPAVVAITKNGSALARRLAQAYHGGCALYMPRRFMLAGDEAHALTDDLGDDVARMFGRHKAIIFIMAAGIVVRMVAPLIKDKTEDPAVVVMDEKGHYAISLLAGHMGGANALAERLSELVGAEAVITTASDVQGSLAVDTMADRLDCAVEDMGAARTVSAAIVNGEEIAAYSHIRLAVVSRRVERTPFNIRFYKSVEEAADSGRDASIVVTPYVLDEDVMERLRPVAVLRPRILAVGMGCNRGTAAEELERLFIRTLKEHSLSPLSVRCVATIEDKKGEPGLVEFAAARGLRLRTFTKEKILAAATPSGRSEEVFRKMGVYGVCEPAALLAAGAKELLAPKRKSANATMAVAEAALK